MLFTFARAFLQLVHALAVIGLPILRALVAETLLSEELVSFLVVFALIGLALSLTVLAMLGTEDTLPE